MSANFTNFEIVTITLMLTGGNVAFVDVEDVAMKANLLAPGRFAWRKYPQQVDLSRVAVALFDARKEKNGSYVLGSTRKGWMLTEAGLSYARIHELEMEDADLSRRVQTPRERSWERSERLRMMSEAAYSKFQKDEMRDISRAEAEIFFRLDDYVVGQARERKLIRVLNIFGDDQELGAIVQELAARIRRKSS